MFRAAGSHGATDLIALRARRVIPLEDKEKGGEKSHVYYFSDDRDGWEKLCQFAQNISWPVYLAFRQKNVRGDDPWRFFEIVDPDYDNPGIFYWEDGERFDAVF